MKNELHESLVAELKSFTRAELVDLHNSYCCEIDDFDSVISPMDEFDEIFSDMSPLHLANRMFYGNFRPCDAYFRFNGYGNLNSSDFPEFEGWIDVDAIAGYILENHDLGRTSIRDWLVENL